MAEKVEQTSKTVPRVKTTGTRLDRIDPELVAKRLGAEKVAARDESRASPAALFALRQELARRLVSTGGRPSLEGTERRQKIPLADEDWHALERLAEGLSDDEVRATPGQVASVLLHRALEETIDEAELKSNVRERTDAASDEAADVPRRKSEVGG